MFKKSLEERLKVIFGFRKTTFDAPSEEFEQDTIFIAIEKSTNRLVQGLETSKVLGEITVYSQEGKLPYGYFEKKIELAKADQKKPLFFYDIDNNVETSPAVQQNLVERKVKFIYLYSAQYDPNLGTMNQLILEE